MGGFPKKCNVKPLTVVGVILLLLGVFALAYPQFHYREKEQVLKIGPLQATAETEHSVPIPPLLGWGLVAVGVGLLVVGATGKRTI